MSQTKSRTISVYLLAALSALGAFSRFTHGRYTPWFYNFQIDHAPDDGGTTATITPIMDTIICLGLLLRSTRLLAALVALIFMNIGLYVQVMAGKDCIWDMVMIGVASLAVSESWA